MADSTSLDKFVLQYQVDAARAQKDLEALDAKVAALNKHSGDSKKSLGAMEQAIKSLREHTGGLGGDIGRIADRMRGMAAPAIAASVAIGGIVLAIRAVMQETKNLNEQRQLAFLTGSDVVSIEAFQRNMRQASGGTIGPAEANSVLQRIGAMGQSAFLDPLMNNADAMKLRQAGVRVTDSDGSAATPQEQVADLSARLASVTTEQAHALGLLLGLTLNQTDALRAAAGATSSLNSMTDLEAQNHLKASEAAKSLSGSMGQIEQSMHQSKEAIGDALLPIFDWILKGVAAIAKLIPGGINSTIAWAKNALNPDNLGAMTAESMGVPGMEGSAAKTVEQIKKDNGPVTDATKKEIDARKASAEDQFKSSQQMSRNIALFGQAVGTFAGAISGLDAWAAWAGTVGQAGGLSNSGNKPFNPNTDTAQNPPRFDAAAAAAVSGGATRGDRNFNRGNIKFGPFAQAHGAIGQDEQGFAKFPDMQTGTNAQIALIQGYPERTIAGIIPHYAPAADHNDDKAYIADVSKRTGIDPNKSLAPEDYPKVAAAMQVHESGAYEDPRQLANDPNARSPYDFSGGKDAFDYNAGGRSKEKLQYEDVAKHVAGLLGIDTDQVLRGHVTKGDVNFELSNLEEGALKDRYVAQQGLKVPGLTDIQRGNLEQALKNANVLIANLNQYGSQLVNKAQDGPRQFSMGQVAVHIAISGAGDPKAVGKAAGDGVVDALKDLTNHASTNRVM